MKGVCILVENVVARGRKEGRPGGSAYSSRIYKTDRERVTHNYVCHPTTCPNVAWRLKNPTMVL